ncbi:hypothetical protein BX616_003365 [Lobosporangium transversale]|nr:hypothetical protein BX616_003365 [Lobosporangium transversale]
MLKVAVTDSKIEPGLAKHIIFRVELQYGDVKWVICRTLYEFYKLHLILAAKRFENLPSFPNQLTYAFSIAKASWGMEGQEKMNYIRETNFTRRRALQNYLLEVLQKLNWTIAYDLYEFLEISAMSLTKDMGWKGKEAYVDTKVTDSSRTICGFKGISRWEKNWAILRDSYMAFCSSVGSEEMTDVFLFDQNFFVEQKGHSLGLNMHHIEIGNMHRRIEIKGDHNREILEWMEHFNKMKQASPWVRSHRFGSFAPQRENAKVRYYVDGKDYFHAVSDAIMAAKTEIYICDWWLSPELYLRRPPEKNEEFRLDRLLKKKAMEGVMIYIVVYKEISLALSLDSAHTKIWLQNLHPNIQVQRHPDHISVNATQFWAHHEKICVIDCRLAFIGGLDLCFGRYDSRTHQLSDYHPSGKSVIWPGQDYSNPRIKDFVNVKKYSTNIIERKLLARMPWHDVHMSMVGQVARDVARHFVQRWNFVKKEKGMKKSHMKFLAPKGEFVSTRNERGWTGSQKVQILRSSTLWSQGVNLERSIQDAYLSSIENAEHFIYIENQFFVTLAAENGNASIKNTIGIALVNRILRAHRERKKFRVVVVMPLMPAFEADIMAGDAGTLRKIMHFQYVSISRGGNSVLERLIAEGVDPDQYIGFFGLRSFDRIKHGKFDAIVEAVKEAEIKQRRERVKLAQDGQQQEQQQPLHMEDSANQDEDAAVKADSLLDVDSVLTDDDLIEDSSLASKFLLQPIPKDEEAKRIKAIASQRKALDEQRTWDESITKHAMSPATKELGYVPATTETSLADKEINEEIQRETMEAEIAAGEHNFRRVGEKGPRLLDGLGTMMHSAIEKIKGTKQDGNLEPLHRRVGQKPKAQRLRHPIRHHRHHHHHHHHGHSEHSDDDDADSVELELEELREKGFIRGYEDFGKEVAPKPAWDEKEVATHEPKSTVESAPTASTTEVGEQIGAGTSVSGGAYPARHPKADIPEVKVEKPIVDDEVDDFVTEQLYIHSKLMIVDDRIIICGSANINDRSQLGYRDSEIAIIIEDTEMVKSRMNGEPYQAGKMAHTLRCDLFKEHLGLLPHVEHDVVTSASVLPVDLNAPDRDPEEMRLELIRKVNEQQQHQQQHQQQNQKEIQSSSATGAGLDTLLEHFKKPQYRFSDGVGHLEIHEPDAEESEAIKRWHRAAAGAGAAAGADAAATTDPSVDENNSGSAEYGSAKGAVAADPHTADRIVMDPIHDSFYEGWWRRVATLNTEIFREVFRCVPDDTVETWDEYRAFVPDPKKVLTGHVAMEGATVEKVTERLQKVTGHLVEFPTRFLCRENLLGGVVEGAVVPMEIFT